MRENIEKLSENCYIFVIKEEGISYEEDYGSLHCGNAGERRNM